MKIHLTISAILLSAISIAQQDMMYSQYMFNALPLNPAIAASSEIPSLSLLHRKQWLNFEGAPATQSLSLHSLILSKNVGLGLVVENDLVGVTGRVNINGSYAYLLKIGINHRIAFGIQGGISSYNSAYSSSSVFRIRDTDDPVFASDLRSIVPNFGFGINYRYLEKFYFGFAVPRMLDYRSPKKLSGKFIDVPKEQQHYYLSAGLSILASEKVKIMPSMLVKYVPAAPIQGDFNLNFLMADMVMVGAAYRTGDAVIAMAGFHVNQKLRIGYAYDITTSELKNYSSNTHEIMAEYRFAKEIIKMKTPRFF